MLKEIDAMNKQKFNAPMIMNEALRGGATMTIGQAIKEERLRQGLSLEALERISGVCYKTIGKWERGKNVPDLLCLIDVCDALEVSIDEILGRNHIKQQFAKEMLTEIDKQIKTHDGAIGLRNLKTYIYRYYEE